MDDGLTRRQFLAAGMGVGALSLGVFPSVSAPASLNVGLIGAGVQGRRLLTHLLTIPTVRVSAVADVSTAALSAAADLLSAQETPLMVQDARELLQSGDVQAVVIATPDHSHASLAAAALLAGKDVYVETPLTRTVEELDQLRTIAETSGRTLYAHDSITTHPGYTAASAILRSGLLGNITRIHVVRRTPVQIEADTTDDWPNVRAFSNGAAIRDAAQSLQLVQRVMAASDPVHLTGHSGVYVWRDGRENPDTLYLIASYAEGFAVSFSTYPGNPARDEFMIYGTRGALDLLRWRITADSTVELPIPALIAQHTSQQLALVAPVQYPVAEAMTGWLGALSRRNGLFPESAAHHVLLAERIASALRA